MESLVAELQSHPSACVLTELRMPSSSVFDLMDLLAERDGCFEVIVATAFASVSTTTQAMRRGVFGVLEKTSDMASLQSEIRAALRSSSERRVRLDRLREAERIFESLSEEEHSVLRLATDGRPNREISGRLSISPRTVDRRRQSALRKMNAESVARYSELRARIEELAFSFSSKYVFPDSSSDVDISGDDLRRGVTPMSGSSESR